MLLFDAKKSKNAAIRKHVEVKRYGIDKEETDSETILKLIAKSQNFYLSNKEENLEKTALFILQEYRSGYYGRITLDRCEKEDNDEQL